MARFAAMEVARFVLLMLAVSFAAFTLVSLSPIDPVQANVGQQALLGMSEAKRAQLASRWDAGVPLLERYGTWLADVLRGDWGTSLRFNAPVPVVVGERFASSAALVACLIDLMSSVPHLVLLILISCAAGRGFAGVTLGMALTHWPSLARVLRAEMRSVLARPYIAESRSLGVGARRIAVAHLLPAVMPQVLVGAILALPHAVMHESSITFLGFGLSPDEPALGVILAEAMGYLTAGTWWLALFPGAVLALSVMIFAHVGELARSVFDPRSMQE